MRLNYITFMVRDIERSIDFYENLAGLKVTKRIEPPFGGKIAFMANASGETMLEFCQFDNAQTVETKGMVISFTAEGELDAIRNKALELGYAPSDIISMPPKPDHFKVEDPDNIVVEFSK